MSAVAAEHLSTYLNDHLAGSVAGLEILDHLIERFEGETRERLQQLKAEIEKDRDELAGLMQKLEIGQSTFRKAAAWLSEKGTELKLRFDDPSGGEFVVFESLEVLSLGIEGKRGLWRALKSASRVDPRLRLVDYDRLQRAAKKQRALVEKLRREAAKAALPTNLPQK